MERDGNTKIQHPDVIFAEGDSKGPMGGLLVEETHDTLLNYLKDRLDDGASIRNVRIQRYARIDKAVATWQRLSAEDRIRAEKEATTGMPQAINTVIPLLHAHLEDLVAFYAGVFSPNSMDVFQITDPDMSEQVRTVVEKMNQDGKETKYYSHLTSSIRSLLKYNLGGFWLDWNTTEYGGELGTYTGNQIRSLDMYNFLWDTSVTDPRAISKDAEWAATVETMSRYKLVREARKNKWVNMDLVLESMPGMAQDTAANKLSTYYRSPPNHAGMGVDDLQEGGGNSLDAYFQGLERGTGQKITGHEVVRMFIRLTPADFDLSAEPPEENRVQPAQSAIPEYELWRIVIVDGTYIVSATPAGRLTEDIPYYLGHLNVDDMGEATKSVAELMKSFQSFVSFLFNVYVAGARSSIWGFLGVNPKYYDMTKLREGDVAGILTMKNEMASASADPARGIARIQGNSAETRTAMGDVQAVMGFLQLMFPSQGLPSQIAGLDRAIESQVAAVMQGVNRRLHMLSFLVDSQVLHPVRMAAFHNIAQFADAETLAKLTGLKHSDVLSSLGSGLKQLNREAAAIAFQKILFAMIQTPDTVQQNKIDLLKMMNYWTNLMDVDADMKQFQIQEDPAQQQQQLGPDGQPIPPQASQQPVG